MKSFMQNNLLRLFFPFFALFLPPFKLKGKIPMFFNKYTEKKEEMK